MGLEARHPPHECLCGNLGLPTRARGRELRVITKLLPELSGAPPAEAMARAGARRPKTTPSGTFPAGNADTGPVPLTASTTAVTPPSLMLIPRRRQLPGNAGSALYER